MKPTVEEMERRIMTSKNKVVTTIAAQTVIKALRSRVDALEVQREGGSLERLRKENRASSDVQQKCCMPLCENSGDLELPNGKVLCGDCAEIQGELAV